MHTVLFPSIARMRRINFKSLSSGSCGNCYYLGVETEEGRKGILIDAGVSPRRLKKLLAGEGLGFDDFGAILVTHDHLDHIRSLGSYCKHLQKPVFATDRLCAVLSRHFVTGPYLTPLRRRLSEGWTEVIPGVISVHAFEVPHDASQTVGFAIRLDGLYYVHITDCGAMTAEALEHCSKADVVVLESNYDPDMLENGPYPQALKDRIRGGNGHLSNKECAAAVAGFLHEGLKYVFLCHLSEHNNSPLLALQAVRSVLPEDSSVRVVPLPRESASPLYNLSRM